MWRRPGAGIHEAALLTRRPDGKEAISMDLPEREMVERVRAAVKDRVIWFALLYRSFKESLPEEEVERLARKAIREFGRVKASRFRG